MLKQTKKKIKIKIKLKPSLDNQNNKKIPAYTENSGGKLTSTESQKFGIAY